MDLIPTRMILKLPNSIKAKPCLILVGKDDTICPVKDVKRAACLLQKSSGQVELYVLEGSHCKLMPENQVLYTQIIKDFIT